MELIQSIKERYSPRAFSDKKIEKEKIDAMFEAARWAPSSSNGQAWRFIYATKDDKELWEKLFDSLVEFNQIWAKTADMLILTAVTKEHEVKKGPYPHNWHDLGLAVGNMMNQVTAMGLHMHQMGGFDPEKAAKNVNLPDDYQAVTMIAVGYKGSMDVLPEKFHEMEKQRSDRKPIEEIVFNKSF